MTTPGAQRRTFDPPRDPIATTAAPGTIRLVAHEATGVPAVAKRSSAVEVAAHAAVDHPHLVRPLEVVDAAGTAPVLVLALAPGGSLAERLAAGGPLGTGRAAALLAPVADALAACHAAGLAHGDVSAANVLLGPDATSALLADLGAARGVAVGVVPGRATGTPGSTAPEVLDGAPTDARSDVWALAAVVVAAATGVVVDPGDPATGVAHLERSLAGAVGAALSPDPAGRPPAAALAERLRAVALPAGSASLPGPVRAPSSLLAPPSTRRTREFGPRPPAPAAGTASSRHRRLVGAVVGGAAAAAVALAVGTRFDEQYDEPASSQAVTTTACPVRPVPPAPGVALVADIDGAGCPSGARWHDGVLVVAGVSPGERPRRYALGAPGDVVALGDWDCDGRATPGTYRPATGVVTLYGSWPGEGPGLAPDTVRSSPADGGAEVVAGPDGCDDLRPTPPRS